MPVISLVTSFGKIEIGNHASFGHIGSDITSVIYSFDSNALTDIQKAFETIQEKHPKSSFMVKKDIGYYIDLHHSEGADIKSIIGLINHVSDLFALLIYSPVFPNRITITKNLGNSESQKKIIIYPSMVLSGRTIKIATHDRSHFHMPITQSSIKLESILNNWLSIKDKYSTIISSIQHETGFRDIHSVHGEIVLYSTQLESISYSQNIDKSARYQFPIDTYATKSIKKILKKIFSKVNTNKLGKNIGDLRNEIAHIEKPKILLKQLNLGDLVAIEQCLQLIAISFILLKIGIEQKLIDKYQNVFTKNLNINS